ncbi:DUF2752 domain-containing protein [Emticicia fontis]
MKSRALKPDKFGYKIILAVIVFTITVYYFYYPSLGHFLGIQCLFNKTTGLYCLGCGGQRAFHALLHGDFITAAQDNLLIFLVLPLIGVKLFEEFSKRKIIPDVFFTRKFVLPVLLFVILFTILRNIPIEPFTYLVPSTMLKY